ALILLLVDSTLRAAEVCSLNCGDVRADVPLVTGKGGHRLPFYLSPPTREVLRELAGDRADNDPLFRHWHGGRRQNAALRRILARLATRAGVELPERPLHSVRHYAARAWRDAGLADMVIMDLMRHSQIQSTIAYLSGPNVANLTRQHLAASQIADLL